MAIVIPADLNQPLREVSGDGVFQLAQLYEILSCDVFEFRPLADGRIMVFDEEGKRKDKPRNERATVLADFATPKQLLAELLSMRETGMKVAWLGEPISDMTTEVDCIVGDALICTVDELQ